MGYGSSPRVFTKLMKPVFAKLREEGFISCIYMDDSCLQGQTEDQCKTNVVRTSKLMDDLGLTINPDKSYFKPTKIITFVGFVLNSENMTVKLTPEKIDTLIHMCNKVLKATRMSIRDFAVLIGKMVASPPGVEFAPMYYRGLEKEKTRQLRLNKGDFDASLILTDDNKSDIQWWLDNLETSYKLINHGTPQIVLYTDSSLLGSGAFNETSWLRTGGQWSAAEKESHINILELKACFLGLKSLCADIQNSHIRINMDNICGVSYIHHFGGKTKQLNKLAIDIWNWAREQNVWFSAAFIQGAKNVDADFLSRSFNDDLEWGLDTNIFQLPDYVAYRPDPKARAIDAFSLNWSNFYGYIFAPFSLIGRILQKVQEDQADIILLAPMWSTQHWFPTCLRLLADKPYRLPKATQILTLPHNPERQYPLKKMTLGVFPLSGKPWKNRAFHQTLSISSSTLGDRPQGDNTQDTSKSGWDFHMNEKLIHFDLLLKR